MTTDNMPSSNVPVQQGVNRTTSRSYSPTPPTSRSPSIPIERRSIRRTNSQQILEENEAEADWKDFVFFSRVVDGISRQNSSLVEGSILKSTNDTLLDSIVKARHDMNEENERLGQHRHAMVTETKTSHQDRKKTLQVNEDCDYRYRYHYPSSLETRNGGSPTTRLIKDFKLVTPLTTSSDAPKYVDSHSSSTILHDHALTLVQSSLPDLLSENYDDDYYNEGTIDIGMFDLEL